MRKTSHRRRFHTDRVINNRQRYAARHNPIDRSLPDGALENSNAYFGCSRPRCKICHYAKILYPKERRQKAALELRAWEDLY